jgi:hypothetical protein
MNAFWINLGFDGLGVVSGLFSSFCLDTTSKHFQKDSTAFASYSLGTPVGSGMLLQDEDIHWVQENEDIYRRNRKLMT